MRPIIFALASFSIILATSCSAETSPVMGELELPDSFSRQDYLAKHFEQLESYCELLEYLYASTDADEHITSEIERLITGKILLAQATSLDPNDLDRQSVRALIAVLRVAENEKFGKAWGKGTVIGPAIEYLRSIEESLEERLRYLRSQIRY